MKPKIWLFLFVSDAALHLVTTIIELPTLNLITKPLLMVLLGAYFISRSGIYDKTLTYLVLAALVGSWFGDTFLMFQNQNPLFFILGLSSFLLAHLAYIFIFFKFKNKANKTLTLFISFVFIAYSLALCYVLWLGLGSMKIPVLVYAGVLTLMGITGVVRNYRYSNMIVIGAILFIASDSLIAYDKFVTSILYGRFLIMFTYILAQYLLINGLSRRIFTAYKK